MKSIVMNGGKPVQYVVVRDATDYWHYAVKLRGGELAAAAGPFSPDEVEEFGSGDPSRVLAHLFIPRLASPRCHVWLARHWREMHEVASYDPSR